MDNQSNHDERHVLKQVLDLLADFEQEARVRILKTIVTYFEVKPNALSAGDEKTADSSNASIEGEITTQQKFSGHKSMSPKEFMRDKEPSTDVDRVVCLAYYLANYLEKPHFKTADISTLNTEAAQRKLSNAAYSINHAIQSGYLVAAPNGSKQLSVLGEQYVEALPNREEAKEVLKRFRAKKSRARQRNRTKASKVSNPEN